jgi:exopolyphosphatase/pppGpp-phosphohydrolase
VRAYATRGTACPGPVGFLDGDALDRAHRELIGTKMTELVDRGVAADDADVLAIATTLLRTIMKTLGADRAMVIDRGLREGVALEHYNRVSANRGRAATTAE